MEQEKLISHTAVRCKFYLGNRGAQILNDKSFSLIINRKFANQKNR